jgi:hypothetical protein
VSFPPDQRRAAAALSPAAARFLDAVEADPRLLRRSAFEPALAAARRVIPTLVGFDPAQPYGLAPWPVLIGAGRRAELARTIEGLGALVRTLPRRFFAGDPARVAAYYGLESPLLAALLLAEPTGIAETICRGDVVDTPGGLRVVELNFGNVASWQDNAVSAAYLASPPIADWLAAEGLTAAWDDTSDRLIRHAVGWCAARGHAAGGRLDLAAVAATRGIYSLDNHPREHYRQRFAAALAELAPGALGELHVVGTEALAFGAQGVSIGGTRIAGVVEELDEVTGRDLFRAFKARRVELFTGPIGPLVLGDKRNLALLSERRAELSPAESDLVDRTVPWTRRVERRAVDYGGVERPLPELLLAEPGAFVLKEATAVGGQGVVVGAAAERDAWRAAVDRALAEGNWIAQEYLATPTYAFQSGDEGWAPHRLVWGPFLFGDDFGGLFVRILPVSRGPVVNLGRGAQVALAFTVGDG